MDDTGWILHISYTRAGMPVGYTCFQELTQQWFPHQVDHYQPWRPGTRGTYCTIFM